MSFACVVAIFCSPRFHSRHICMAEQPRKAGEQDQQPMKQTIALVDDDRNILTSVSMTLEQEGYQVRTYTDGESALQGLLARPVDLAVLDIKMPRMDGMELLQRLRLERIRALLRRNEASRAGTGAGAASGVIVRGDLVLDENKHQCTWKGRDIDLTVTEFLLVKALALRPGMVKSRDQLIDAAYGETTYVDDRTVDSHVKRIRKKFRAIDENFNQIETLYGIGYRYKDG